MAKKLKIWNGQGYCCRKHNDPVWDRIPFKETLHKSAIHLSVQPRV